MSKKKKNKKRFNNYLYRNNPVNSNEINLIAFHVFGSLYYSQEYKEPDTIDV